MVMAAYDAHDELWFHALVFAPSSWEALEIAELHRDSGFGVGSTSVSLVPRFVPPTGSARDHLQAALDQNQAGIGHLELDGSWMILPAGERPPQSIRPTRMEMHALADDDGDGYVIFARHRDRAEEIYLGYLADPNALPRGWVPLTHDHWITLGLVRHERQAASRGVEGVGRYSAAGWVLLPIDYDRIGVSPP